VTVTALAVTWLAARMDTPAIVAQRA